MREQAALIMKGGGVKGLAYVGALKELERYYEFTWFVGTSAGAIAAVLLAAGYTTTELERELGKTNFKKFLDAPFYKLLWNLIVHNGFYKAATFTAWVDDLLAIKLQSPTRVKLSDLKRLTIYASRREKAALIFDSLDPRTKEVSAAFAVRCSMSIPFVFTPQRESGMRVLDGGMRNNYPVDILLKENPGLNFIGLYLGPEVYKGEIVEPSVLSDMLSMWTDAYDAESVSQYRDKTVVIDPTPISTINFSLTESERDFLLKAGRAAALKFLSKKPFPGVPSQTSVDEAYAEVNEARGKVISDRKRRRLCRLLMIGFCIVFVISAGMFLCARFHGSHDPNAPLGDWFENLRGG